MKSSISEEEVTSRVMKEYHGLHNYANEFWLEHVLEYSRLMGTIESGVSSDLARVLGTLTEVHKKPYTLQLDHESAETGESISCLKALNCPPAVRRLIRDILLFRETLREYQDGQISAQGEMLHSANEDPHYIQLNNIQRTGIMRWRVIQHSLATWLVVFKALLRSCLRNKNPTFQWPPKSPNSSDSRNSMGLLDILADFADAHAPRKASKPKLTGIDTNQLIPGSTSVGILTANFSCLGLQQEQL